MAMLKENIANIISEWIKKYIYIQRIWAETAKKGLKRDEDNRVEGGMVSRYLWKKSHSGAKFE